MLKQGKSRHEQISDWLRSQIADGIYSINEKLPSESELGERFGVSRITVRRALQTLENEGSIYRRQGLGSFVREGRVQQGLIRLNDFVEDMTAAGIRASSKVLHFKPEKADSVVAAALGVSEDKSVFRLDRLRLGDGAPIAFDRTWLPAFYAQMIEQHDLAKETIYRVLENQYDIPVTGGRFRIQAVNARQDVADLLDVPVRRALLLIERVSFAAGDKPIYFQRRYYRSDKVAYELFLERGDNGGSLSMPLQEFEPVFTV
ncbi:MAG: GntR family transcriptional regulator [Rhodothermales bacterium]|nr:GntR family transcriptional regulator [Rhodothermales bacterium]